MPENKYKINMTIRKIIIFQPLYNLTKWESAVDVKTWLTCLGTFHTSHFIKATSLLVLIILCLMIFIIHFLHVNSTWQAFLVMSGSPDKSICVPSLSHVRLFANPWSSSVHGILQARILEWVAISSSRWSYPTQRWNPCLLYLLHWQADSTDFFYQ